MRPLIAAPAVAVAGAAAPFQTGAQNRPDTPVHIIVAFTPGSATDVSGRSVSNELSAKLGQPAIVENKPGAGGTIAAGTDVLHVPDKGTPEALNDVMGGRVEYFFSPVVAALSLVRDKWVVRELDENAALVKAAGIKAQ